ncbi:radical SAM protein [Candidatus Bathyarchaeota archaeon ex4484_231]|nr:MAG: radical SAM protein [Candidatus Bathyarchaeota archaeon ex4484_231]RJS75714.1 MAG: radical SAM protein [Candidatus Bathyarchaeota archaeon]
MPVVPELNVIKKDWRKVDLRIALCYPNVYRAGMTGLTVRLLYALLNSREDVLCERFFLPDSKEPLRSLESNQSLEKFDVVAFTLQYEEDYLNVMRMLLLSGFSPKRADRKPGDPLVIAGGPCATANPEPLADYIDLFVIGEAEPVLDELIDCIKSFKDPLSHVVEFADLKGVYVPEVSNLTRRVWVRNLDDAPHPLAQQVPLVDERSRHMTIFGQAFAVEVSRGCSRRCRFCLLRHIGHPKRERSIERAKEILSEGIRYTPVGKVSLIGASIFDYSGLEEICEHVVSRGLELAIPSIRPESITEHLAELLAKGKQRNVSMAPDAASPRMQEVICKEMDEEDLKDAAKILLSQGVNRLKLYFIIGLPGETREDLEAIVDLSRKIADAGYGPRAVHLSINPLVPKPHTPFQWEKAPSVFYVRKSLDFLRRKLKGDNRIVVDALDPRHFQIQAILSLGDRRIGKVIELAAQYGGGLGAWRRAMKECEVKAEHYIRRKGFDEPMPWGRIDVGLSKRYLKREAEKCRPNGS